MLSDESGEGCQSNSCEMRMKIMVVCADGSAAAKAGASELEIDRMGVAVEAQRSW
jgi:hypothetical protein